MNAKKKPQTRTRGPGQSVLLLLDVIDALNELKIPYAVIGAVAVAYYGIVRASLDADALISLALNDQGIPRLKKLLLQKKLRVIVKKGDTDDPLIGVMLVEDDDENQVDLILGIRGLDKKCFERTLKASFRGREMRMIGLEDLIAMKLFAGSRKDIDDVKGILEVSREKLDIGLLKSLTGNYGRKPLKILEGML